MIVDRISYKKIFPIGSFVNETIGMEAELEAGDDAQECLVKLKNAIEDLHRKTNPGLYVVTQGSEGRGEFINALDLFKPEPIPSLDYKAKEKLEIDIDNAKVLYDLQILQGEVAKYGLITQYMDKLRQLS